MARLGNYLALPCIVINVKICTSHQLPATASWKLCSFSHNYPMPQISSIDRLLIAAQYMTDTLKHPHPDVTFSTIVDETITALTTLSAIFKKNSTRLQCKKQQRLQRPPKINSHQILFNRYSGSQ